MMESDPVAEALCLRKFKMIGYVRNNRHIDSKPVFLRVTYVWLEVIPLAYIRFCQRLVARMNICE